MCAIKGLILPLVVAYLVVLAQCEYESFNEEIISNPDEENGLEEDSLKIRRDTGAPGFTPTAVVSQGLKVQSALNDAEIEEGGGDEIDETGNGTEVEGGETGIEEVTQPPTRKPKRKWKKKKKDKWRKKQRKKERKSRKKNKWGKKQKNGKKSRKNKRGKGKKNRS